MTAAFRAIGLTSQLLLECDPNLQRTVVALPVGSDVPQTRAVKSRLFPDNAALMPRIPTSAPRGVPTSPARGTCDSVGLIRMIGHPCLCPNSRTLGMAVPAPISMTTGRSDIRRHEAKRDDWIRVLPSDQDQSLNIRMAGRARPSQLIQRGMSFRIRQHSSSITG